LRDQFDQAMEVWAASPKREIMEHFTTEEVMEATAQIVEHTPEMELNRIRLRLKKDSHYWVLKPDELEKVVERIAKKL